MADSLSVVDKNLKMHCVFLHFRSELRKKMHQKLKRWWPPIIDKIEVVESEEPLVEPIRMAEELSQEPSPILR